MTPVLCPRCGIGFDDDGDGNCGVCAKLKRVKVTFTKEFWIQKDRGITGIGNMYANCSACQWAKEELEAARRAEADKLFPEGCKCGNNGGGDCDWCVVYYGWEE